MKSYLPLALLFLVASLPATAQQLTESRFESAEIRPVTGSPSLALEAADQVPAQGDRGGIFSTRSLIHAVGGAIVGGWIGLFSAQVVHSDWDEVRDGDFGDRRRQWAAAGAFVGLIGSRLVTRTTAPLPGPPAVRSERNRDVILADEIRRSRANDAYELISNLRKEWLVPRGTNSWTETTTGTIRETEGRRFVVDIEEGRDMIIVYMDDIRIGGPEDMRDIALDGITKAEFIDARRATYLYGAGHAHGAIRLSTEVEVPNG
jgi:hypothetical protein